MAAIYQIRDWDRHFENNKSRERTSCSWVPLPNKQHGIGFSRVVSEPDGAAIYGVFVMMVCACSQQESPRAGWLTDDGTRSGTPLGVEDLALKFRRPKSEIERAFQVLSGHKVGWLTAIQKETGEAKTPPAIQKETAQQELLNAESARRVPAECPRREEKRKEMKRSTPAVAGVVSPHSLFVELWTNAYHNFFQTRYAFNGGKDGAAVKRLLATGCEPNELVEIAVDAWRRPKEFNCKQAVSIAGFSSRFNEIRSEIARTKPQFASKSFVERDLEKLQREVRKNANA